MTIATYTELVTELGAWLNRSDLSDRIPTFVRLFEARMNRRLRAPDMEQSFSFTTVSGTTIYALTANLRELRELYIETSVNTRATEYTIVAETIVFNEDPGDGITVRYSGFVTLTGLDGSNAANWLLDDHPDAYLYGTLAEAYAYLRDEASAATYKGLTDEALSEITREANSKRLPAGPLQMAPAVRE